MIKEFMVVNKIKSATDKLADHIPDRLTGVSEVMSQKYASIYGKHRACEMATEEKRRTGRMYVAIFFLLFLIITTALIKSFTGSEAAIDLSRSSYGGDSKTLSAEVEARYKSETQSQNVDITINPKDLTEDEKDRRLKLTKENLGALILKDNTDLNNVNSNLNLLTVDPDTGVEVAWNSESKELISDDGEVNLLLAEENEKAVLNAHLRLEDVTEDLKINIAFGKPGEGEGLREAVRASVNNMVTDLNESDNGNELVLPGKTKEGVSLNWNQREDGGVAAQIAIVLLIGIIIYLNRYRAPNKKIQEIREDIIRDFPDFINKLVLLLNAGMVVTAAFQKISDDYKNRINKDDRRYLFEEFCVMDENIRFANSGFLTELNDIAQRSGVRDVMRFNTIIVDNIDKGSTLVEKLQSESRLLWTGRIKLAEEKGRIAETKLTFPMVLQLLVLIIITIAPAAMEM